MLYLAALFVYFIDVYENYLTVLVGIYIAYTVYLIFLAFYWGFAYFQDEYEDSRKYKNSFLVHMKNKFYIILLSLMILSPTSKTIYISSGLLIGQQAINKAENSELLNKAYKVLELQMNKYLDELIEDRPSKSK